MDGGPDDQLAILPQSAAGSTGNRYTEADKTTAFVLWRTVCGRSARKVSQRLGISDETIRRWGIDDNWTTKADADDIDDYGASRIATVALVVNQIVPSIETAIDIRDNHANSPKDRLAAAQWLAGLAGVSPVSKIESAVTDNRPTVVPHLPDFSTMSHDELRAYEEQVRKQRQRKTMVATERLRT